MSMVIKNQYENDKTCAYIYPVNAVSNLFFFLGELFRLISKAGTVIGQF